MHQKRRKDLLVVVTVYACNVSSPVLLIPVLLIPVLLITS